MWIHVTAKTPALEGSGVINFSNFIIRVVNFTILCLLGKGVKKEAPFLDNGKFY
jgi:hypothetical protein